MKFCLRLLKSLFYFCLVAAVSLLIGCGGGGGGDTVVPPDVKADPIDSAPPVVILATAVYDEALNSVALNVEATDTESGIALVQARITPPNQPAFTIDLTYNSVKKVYTGTYTNVPENTGPAVAVYSVTFSVLDKSSNKSTKSTTFQVQPSVVEPLPDTVPPIIAEQSATYMPNDNRALLKTKVTDKESGVKNVAAVVTFPTGETIRFDLTYDAVNSLYVATYNGVPTNWTFAPVTYIVDFTAYDESGNTATAQTSFEVDGLEAPPPPKM